MAWFRRHYGAGPFHLLGLLGCFAVSLYAVAKVFGAGGAPAILAWFAACVVLHDLIGWPLYALADRRLVRAHEAGRGSRPPAVPWINHVRVPTVISGVLLIMFGPLILRTANSYYESITGFSEDVYLRNWLLVTTVLFAGSGVIYLARLIRHRPRKAGER